MPNTSTCAATLCTAALAGTILFTTAAHAQFGVRQTPRPTNPTPPTPAMQPAPPAPPIVQPPPPANPPRRIIRSGGMNIDLINRPARNGVPVTWNIPPRAIHPRPPIICPPPVWPCPPTWRPPSCDVPIQPLPVNVGSGISIGGSWQDDRWNIGFQIGSGGAYHTRWRRNTCVAVPIWNWCNFFGTPWIGWGQSTWSQNVQWGSQPSFGYAQGNGQYDPRLTMYADQLPVNTQPAPMSPLDDPDLTPLDRARFLMSTSTSNTPNAAAAVTQLRLHLRASPDDTRAQRWLAVALLEDRRIDDAQAMMRMAYRTDPALGTEPMLPREMGFGRDRWRSLVTRASTAANATNTASGWLLLATLMQAEERQTLAKQMIERARNAGLESDIAGGFN
jgi:hypothetical protein